MADQAVDATAAALLAGVRPQTVRMWKARGLLHPVAHNDRGWPLYDLDEIERVATRQRRQRGAQGDSSATVTAR